MCTDGETKQIIPCVDAGTGLIDCVKEFGTWVNVGECEATGLDKDCEPGLQNQTRACTDGTTDMCTDGDTKQTILCVDANSTLPDCDLG